MNKLLITAVFIFCGVHASLFGGKFSDVKKSIAQVNREYPQTQAALDGNELYEFNEEEMLAVVKNMLKHHSGNMPHDAIDKLNSAHKSLIKQLKNYKVTGIGFNLDLNFAFLFNQQNPVINVCYKNEQGDLKYRKYQSFINSFGFKFEFALKLNIMFFTDTNVNFYDSNKDLFIDGGFDFCSALISGLDITYAHFQNAPGGIVILGIPIGLTAPGFSIVTDGALVPVN